MSERILEKDLQLPALYLINLNNGKITTSELSDLLRNILKPIGEDLEINRNRSDDKFSQIVRNLTASERSFVKNGFIHRESGRSKPLFITDKGIEYLTVNKEIVNYLFSSDFGWDDLMKTFGKVNKAIENNRQIEVFNEIFDVQEGIARMVKTKVYERSSRLRNTAIEYFTQNGDILCKACKFSFKNFYGEIGNGYIEIHHINPIFKYKDEEIDKTIEEALNNVAPLCSNCHRMIHKKQKVPLPINILIDQVNKNGIFER